MEANIFHLLLPSSSTYLLSFDLIIFWNKIMLAVKGMRPFKRNLGGSENLGGGGGYGIKRLELVKNEKWGISTVRLSDSN